MLGFSNEKKKFLFSMCNPILPDGQFENEAVDEQELMLDYHHSNSKEKACKNQINAY